MHFIQMELSMSSDAADATDEEEDSSR